MCKSHIVAFPTFLKNEPRLGGVIFFRETQKADMLCHAGKTNENTNTIKAIYCFIPNLKCSQVQCFQCVIARSILADSLPGFFGVVMIYNVCSNNTSEMSKGGISSQAQFKLQGIS